MLIKSKPVSPIWMITNNSTAEISAFWQGFPARQKALSSRNSEQNALWTLFVRIIHCVWTFCQLRNYLTESHQDCLLPLPSRLRFLRCTLCLAWDSLDLRGTILKRHSSPVVENCQSKLHQSFGGFGLCPTFTHYLTSIQISFKTCEVTYFWTIWGNLV